MSRLGARDGVSSREDCMFKSWRKVWRAESSSLWLEVQIIGVMSLRELVGNCACGCQGGGVGVMTRHEVGEKKRLNQREPFMLG